MTHTLTRLAGLTGLLGCLLLAACSGIEIIPDDTSAFAATGHTRYAWRSEPLSQDGYSKSKVYQADPIIRAAVDKRLAELGYRRTSAEDAQFLVDYHEVLMSLGSSEKGAIGRTKQLLQHWTAGGLVESGDHRARLLRQTDGEALLQWLRNAATT